MACKGQHLPPEYALSVCDTVTRHFKLAGQKADKSSKIYYGTPRASNKHYLSYV